MAFDISIITGVFYEWIKSGIFWLIVAAIFTIATVVFLIMNKKSKLKYNCLELISFGNGKLGINQTTAGLFKNKSAIFNLWDYGNESMYKVKDGRIIQQAGEGDLHDIFQKKGFIVRRKDGDPKILVPVSRAGWINEKLMFEIAPADFRDASVKIIESASKETSGWIEKCLPYIMLGAIILFFIISMILATQFFNRTVDKAGEILLKVGQNTGNVQGGVSP